MRAILPLIVYILPFFRSAPNISPSSFKVRKACCVVRLPCEGFLLPNGICLVYVSAITLL